MDDIRTYCTLEIVDKDGNELVTKDSGCPACGERRMDYLEWIDDETVECLTCGVRYDPSED